jgi:hypothetical protein
MSLKTATERSDMIREMIQDPDLDMTLREAYTHIYHWIKYEQALRRAKKSTRALKKIADQLNADIAAFNLRKEMKNL